MLSISSVHMYLDGKSSGWCWQLGCKLGGNSLIILSGPNATEKKRMFLKTDVLALSGKKNKANIFWACLCLHL